MADTPSDIANTAADTGYGTWHPVEQAAVALGLSVRTVNRHISAQKLRSRLIEGRREVFVPAEAPAPVTAEPQKRDAPVPHGQESAVETPGRSETSASSEYTKSVENPGHSGQFQPTKVSLDFETALAMADSKAELAVNAYQSLTRSIESQAFVARRMARVAWCIVGVLVVGVTFALVWTATRVTSSDAESQHARQDAQRLREEAQRADSRADKREKEMTDMQQKLSDAQQRAARAEGRAAVYEEMQGRQATSRPTSRPSIIDRLTAAFGSGQ